MEHMSKIIMPEKSEVSNRQGIVFIFLLFLAIGIWAGFALAFFV